MSDFGNDVIKEIKELKEYFSKKPIIDNSNEVQPGKGVDGSVAEQVNADLDGIIKKHGG